jgi:DNA topoisomerase-1
VARKKQPSTEDTPATPRTPRRKSAAATSTPGDGVPATKPPRTRRKPAATDTADAPVASSGRGVTLVIVESPTKAKTINKYLGSNFKVLASYGHVRDLPRRRRKGEMVAGIDLQTWRPTYVVEDRKEGRKFRTPKEILAELKREANKAARVYLATDPDREGEAIAWHIEDELKLDPNKTARITFNEITRSAVQTAIQSPKPIDMDRVHAQEARRILDRVVGYPLSNLLGKKITRGLSAGRVQSVALRLVVDREREIEAFKPEEFWKITALLAPQGTVKFEVKPHTVTLYKPRGSGSGTREGADSDAEAKEGSDAPKEKAPPIPPGTFLAELAEWNGEKFAAVDQGTVTGIATALDTGRYFISKIEQKDRNENAPPPFTTSTLQQQASLRLRFTSDRTMKTAQKLYEGVDLGSEGSVALITYMRTDSTRVSNDALNAVRAHIDSVHGASYLPAKPNFFKAGKSAQEAHEAIRPTDVSYTPERVAQLGLHGDQLRLYTLIYNRFVASQMAAAVWAVTSVDVTADCGNDRGLLRATGRVLKFEGFRKVLAPGGKSDDAELPLLKDQQALDRLDLTASQHFTQPPPRFNEASLIKALEKEGIGRPSTYASIIGKITSDERGYIEVRDRRFFATQLGKDVTDLLVTHFPRVMDVKFTSQMEEELDDIETRKTVYHQVLTQFWGPFEKALREAEEQMPSKRGEETGEMCPRCGKPLVKNFSRKLKREFIGCSGYKDGCKYIKPREGEPEPAEPVVTDIPCPACGKMMVKKSGRKGEFLSCSGYPECKTTMALDAEGRPVITAKQTTHKCEKCGQDMVIREGRRGPFLACTGYPKCKNAKDVDAEGNPIQAKDTGIKCEKCSSPMAIRKGPRGPFLGCTAYPKCRSTKQMTPELREQLKDQLPAPAAKKPELEVTITDTCPECGGPMKLRQYRGRYFLGCTGYPKCKGTRQPSAELLEQITATAAPS